jgi:hypothetical protein
VKIVPNHSVADVLDRLRSSHFQDLAGTRFAGSIPVSERLINELVAGSIPRDAPVREVRVQPLDADAFSVRVSPRAALLPSLTLRLEIDRQPEMPGSPVLVLRMATMGGLLGLAAAALPFSSMLPLGVRLDGDRIAVDLRALAAVRGAEDLLEHVRQLRVNTAAGRVVLHIDVAIGS